MIRQTQQPPQGHKTSLQQTAPRVLRAPLQSNGVHHRFFMPGAPQRPPVD